MRKFDLNDNYFNVIDTENKAYFLGLLYADGCNTGTVITIGLVEEDSYILEVFIKELKYKGSLYFRRLSLRNPNHKNQYRLDIRSKILAKDLINLGCIPRKTLTLKFPDEDIVPNHLIHHFIRGYFDGDGSISFSKVNNYFYPNFSIVGTKLFCQKLNEILKKECNLNRLLYLEKYRDNIYKVRTGSQKDCLRIFHYIYKDSTLFLTRKKDLFSKIRTTRIPAKKNGIHANMKELYFLEKDITFKNREEASEYFNVSKTTIGRYINNKILKFKR